MIDLTLDSLTVPGIPDYTPPFGTQKDPLVSLSTVETNNNIIKPFTAQRAVEFSHDETLSRIERNAVLVFTGDADATLDISNVTTFKGNEIKIVNSTSHTLTIKYLEVGEESYSTIGLTKESIILTADSTTTYTDNKLIQDEKTSLLTTWSSSKIAEELSKVKPGYAGLAATLGQNFTNGILTERNLVNVLGATSVADAFAKLQAKTSVGDFTNLGLGDYIDIPSITFDGKTLTHNPSYENLRVQIIAFDYFKHYYNTTHHAVMQFKHCLFKKEINSANSNVGGYPATPMADYLSTTFGAGLEAAMGISCLSIKQFSQTAVTTWSNSTGYKVFLPTENQLIGHKGSSTVATGTVSYELGQFPYYAINPKGLIKNFNGVLHFYWTASPLFAASNYFAVVDDGGFMNSGFASNGDIGVAPVFCI